MSCLVNRYKNNDYYIFQDLKKQYINGFFFYPIPY